MGNFIDASLKKLGVKMAVRKVTLEDEVRAWVGETGQGYLSRVTCKAGVLSMEFSHPAWLQEASSRKAELLKVVQTRFADLKVREVKVTLSRGGPGKGK